MEAMQNKFLLIVSLFFTINVLNCIYGMQFSSPCKDLEMRKPKEEFFELIAKFQTPNANPKLIMKDITDVLNSIPNHIEDVKNYCGEEKTKVIEKLVKLQNDIKLVHDVIKLIDDEKYEAAKEMTQSIKCIFIMHYLVQKYVNDHDNFDKILEMLKIMDDMNAINLINDAFIYAINDSNIQDSEKIISLMEKQIVDNNATASAEDILFAKHNMKEMVQRNFHDCFKCLAALYRVDNYLADQAMYYIIFHNVTEDNYIPAFDKTLAAPNKHLKIFGLRAIYDKLYELGMEHGLILGKVLILTNSLIKDDELQSDPLASDIAKSMLKDATEFAKNVMTGYNCQDVTLVESIIFGKKEETISQHNDSMVLFDEDQSEDLSNGIFVEKPDGDFLMITVQREFHGYNVAFSVLIKNADYPENIHMKGTIVSRKVIEKIPATWEEIHAMNPPPIVKLCSPFSKTFMLPMDKHSEHRKQMYENYRHFIGSLEFRRRTLNH